jgi:tetratricopeptide (TPR) repeat protein
MGNKKSKTRNIISIVLVVLIGLLVWYMVSTQSKWKYGDMGLEGYEMGNYQDAIDNYTKAIESNPDDAFLYNNRGLAYFRVKEYKKSISDYTKAIELKPDYAVAYCNRGLAYFKIRSFDEAISDYTKAIELDPKYADAYYNRGLAHNRSVHYYSKPFTDDAIARFNKAVKDFHKALEFDPDYILAHAGLGNAYYRYGEWDKATKYYNKALASEDLILKKVGKEGLEGIYHSRARNYNQFQRTFHDAVSDYRKALELNPENLDALNHIAMISVINRNYKGGLEVCNRAFHLIESREKFAGAGGYIYSYRAQCHYGLGEYDKAIPDFKKAMKNPALIGETYRCMGFCYLKTGETEKAKEAFEKGIAYLTKEIEKGGPYGPGTAYRSYNERGLCYTGLGEYDKAISDFEKTRESNPPYLLYGKDFYVEASKNLGITYREMGDDKKAKSFLEEALKRAEMPEVGMSRTAKEIRELLGQMSKGMWKAQEIKPFK